jgi:ABC-type thiamine transport system substrate-binding protein
MCTPRPAQAYTDPGSGLLLWQILVAGAVGLLFYFRKFKSKLFRRKDEHQD